MIKYIFLLILIFSFSQSYATKPFSFVDSLNQLKSIELIDSWNTWPDYVFKPNYNLMPLLDVEKSIEQNGHLPGIPSAEDVRDNGINVTEVQTKMLEKIEVLTLYMIELKKENEQLKQEINKLK